MADENAPITRKLAALSFALSMVGLVAQFGVRLIMTSELGIGAEYDGFLLAMIPASVLAQVAFQALASALVPELSGMILDGQKERARQLCTRLVQTALLASLALTIVVGFVCHVVGLSASVFVPVMICWGLLGGWAVIQRQLLIYFAKPVHAGFSALLPALTLIVVQLVKPLHSLEEIIIVCSLGHVLSVVINEAWLVQCWGRIVPGASISSNRAEKPLGMRILLWAALPIFLASFNSQAMAAIDQGFAAWLKVGGISLLSLALAISRVPLSLANSLMFSLCYRDIVTSCQQLKKGQRSTLPTALTRAFQLQAFLVFPAIALILVAHDDIAILLFCRGKLDREQALQIGQLLFYFTPVLLVTMVQAVQIPFLVALGEARRALRFEIWLTIASAVLNLIFVPFFGLGGLLLSTALSTGLIAAVLGHQLQSFDPRIQWGQVVVKSMNIGASAVFCGFVGVLAREVLIHSGSSGWDMDTVVFRVSLVFGLMAGAYTLSAVVSGVFSQFFSPSISAVEVKPSQSNELIAIAS